MPQTKRKRGRPKKTWIECVKEDAGGSVIKAMRVAQDRKRFRTFRLGADVGVFDVKQQEEEELPCLWISYASC